MCELGRAVPCVLALQRCGLCGGVAAGGAGRRLPLDSEDENDKQ